MSRWGHHSKGKILNSSSFHYVWSCRLLGHILSLFLAGSVPFVWVVFFFFKTSDLLCCYFSFRNLSAIQDREICCYSISCKEKDNIGKLEKKRLGKIKRSGYVTTQTLFWWGLNLQQNLIWGETQLLALPITWTGSAKSAELHSQFYYEGSVCLWGFHSFHSWKWEEFGHITLCPLSILLGCKTESANIWEKI